MGKGGGQAATQTTIQDVPEWAKPYYEDILQKGKAITEEPYQAYGGQRLADLSGDVAASQQAVRGLAGQPIAGFGEAASTFGSLGARAQQLGQQAPGAFGEAGFSQAGFNPYQGFQAGTAAPFSGFRAGIAQAAQYDPARQFSGQEVSEYMSPYMQAVVDRERQSAIQEFERQRGSRAAQAVQAGAFGGSRQAVQESLAEEALAKQLGDIQATGSQRAFEQAAAQFGADRAAQMETQARQVAELARAEGLTLEEAARVQQARAAELARVQGVNIGEAARVQAGQAAELARTEAGRAAELGRFEAGRAAEMARVQQARADEAMRQRQFELQAMGFSAEQARAAAELGERQRAADIQSAQLLEAQGLAEMARQQAERDIAYQDFLRQQQFPMEQLGQYSSILRGLPVANAGTATTYQPTPSAGQQALGTGISLLGLYKGLQ